MIKYVIGIHGKQGAGKSTLAESLKEAIEQLWGFRVTRLAYAGPVYDVHNLIMEYFEQYGITKVLKNGPLLQRVGDIGRDLYEPDFWVHLLEKSMAKIHASSGEEATVIIVEDVRYLNEAKLLSKFAASIGAQSTLVRLQAPEEIRKSRCSQWRENTGHSSETSLDGTDHLWHVDIETGSCDKGDTLRKALEYIEHALALASPETLKLERAVATLNSVLKWLKSRDKGANFRWDYLPEGTKQLSLISVEPISHLCKEKELHFAKMTEEVMAEYKDMSLGIGQTPSKILPRELVEQLYVDQHLHGADPVPVDMAKPPSKKNKKSKKGTPS